MNSKVKKYLKVAVVCFLLLVIIAGLTGPSDKNKKPATPNETPVKQNESQEKQKTSSRCIDVPNNVVLDINEGFNTKGLSFVNAKAVKSNDFKSVYFVSGDIQGPGLEGPKDIATFVVNKLDGGIYDSVNGAAKEFSLFPDSSKNDAKVTMNDDGAQESQDCL